MNLDKNIVREIVEQLKNELIPIGSILIYSSEKVPHGYLPCDGSELSKKAYPELYALIGGTWGETKDSFFLPDLQGQFIRGWDKDGNVDPNRILGSEQKDSLQGHSHEIQYTKYVLTDNRGDHMHQIYYNSHAAVTSVGGLGNTAENYTFWEVYGDNLNEHARTKKAGSHRHIVPMPQIDVLEPQTSTFQPIRISTETRSKNVALMFCIKVK